MPMSRPIVLLVAIAAIATSTFTADRYEYRLLATTKTSTMQIAEPPLPPVCWPSELPLPSLTAPLPPAPEASLASLPDPLELIAEPPPDNGLAPPAPPIADVAVMRRPM